MNEKEAIELARTAYEEIPFYKWFYNKQGCDVHSCSYRDLPILRKKFFFDYEYETGQPYHGVSARARFEHENASEPRMFFISTSGSTGKPLVAVHTGEDIIESVKIFKKVLQQHFEGPYSYVGLEFPPQITGMQAQYWGFKELGTKEALVPMQNMNNVAKVQEIIAEAKPNFIIDYPGKWVKTLLTQGMPLKKLGIKLVLMLEPVKGAKELVEKNGIIAARTFACVEVGVIGAPCGYQEDIHILRDLLIHVFDQENLSAKGRGEMVVTQEAKPFPFIKYTNDDIIDLRIDDCPCGHSGYTFKLIGRSQQVKIPDVTGVYLNINDIVDALRLKHNMEPLILRLKAKKEGEEYTMLATVIESEDVSEPQLLPREWSSQIMLYGSGSVDQRFFHSVPVVKVPKGTLPAEDRKAVVFRNLEHGALTSILHKRYENLLKIIQHLTSATIMSPSPST